VSIVSQYHILQLMSCLNTIYYNSIPNTATSVYRVSWNVYVGMCMLDSGMAMRCKSQYSIPYTTSTIFCTTFGMYMSDIGMARATLYDTTVFCKMMTTFGICRTMTWRATTARVCVCVCVCVCVRVCAHVCVYAYVCFH